jgi:hypothetical protein
MGRFALRDREVVVMRCAVHEERTGAAFSGAGTGLVAVTSEGGLFDYAEDAGGARHLRSIQARCPEETVVCGTVNSSGRALEVRERTLNAAFGLERA